MKAQPHEVMIAIPTQKGSSIESSDKEYRYFATQKEANNFVEQYNKYNRFNASRAYYERVKNA